MTCVTYLGFGERHHRTAHLLFSCHYEALGQGTTTREATSMRVSGEQSLSLLWILWTALCAKCPLVDGFVVVPVDRLGIPCRRRRRRATTTRVVVNPTTNCNDATFGLYAQLQQEQQKQPVQRRKRDWFLRTILRRRSAHGTAMLPNRRMIRNITTLSELEEYWRDDPGLFTIGPQQKDCTALLRGMNVMGDTQMIGSSLTEFGNYTHPVVQLLHERQRRRQRQAQGKNTTTTTASLDRYKIALCIEGGGMRGCVSAGMVCAIHHLNLTDSLNVVYGSSAGTIVGAYLITGQLPWFGPELYYDCLTTAGRRFIDTRRLLRALGMGLLDPRLVKDVVTRRQAGKPVLNLPFLLRQTVQETKRLDWPKFVERQATLPLNVVTSGLHCESAVVLNMTNGGFQTLDELTDCMHASCLLPGIAGPVMNLDRRVLRGEPLDRSDRKMICQNNLDTDRYEPLADALLYEPLPFRTALERDGVTHAIVLRSRPDGVDVTGRGGGWPEDWIGRRFFARKNKLPRQYERWQRHEHKYLYAADILRLNAYAVQPPAPQLATSASAVTAAAGTDAANDGPPYVMTIAVPPQSPEVSRLEVRRRTIFEGMRRGFARAYDCLVDDPELRGRGAQVAEWYFPDEILDYDPTTINATQTESAFATYLKQNNITPKAWQQTIAVDSHR
jgi:predicted acylesterase/phospholipase RssA